MYNDLTRIKLFKVFFLIYIMDKIIKKFCIKKHKKGFYNLNNIVKNIIKSKSPASYMNKITNKKSIGTIFYITEEQFIQILKKSRSVNGKEAYKLLKNQTVEEKNEIVDTKIDSNNNLFSFNNKGLKVVHVGDEIWFKGKDVAKILEYENTKKTIINHVDQDDKITVEKLRGAMLQHLSVKMKEVDKLNGYRFVTHSNVVKMNKVEKECLPDTHSNPSLELVKSEHPHTIFINESGLYSLIMRSRMKSAKKFKSWVTKEVLPSIRKTGSYSLQKQPKLLYDLNNFKNKSCFYILNIRDNLYKYGISDNMERRGNDHLNNFKNPKIVKIFELKNYSMCIVIEKNVNSLVKQLGIRCSYDIDKDKILIFHKKNSKKECFVTNETHNLEYIIDKVNNYIDDIPDGNFSIELAIQKEKTKQCKIEMEKNIKELELKNEGKKEITRQLEIKLELKKLNIEERKLLRDESRELNINEEIIEDSDYDQDSDANTTSSESPETNDSESEEEENDLKTNKCLDCNTSIYKSSKRCIKCNSKLRFKMGTQKRKVIKRPSHKQLKKDLENSSYVKVGKKYNVSDNSVRKWLKTYEKYDNK